MLSHRSSCYRSHSPADFTISRSASTLIGYAYSCSFIFSVSQSTQNFPLSSLLSSLVCCTCWTDILVSDLAFHSSYLHYQSLTFIIVHFAFLFTAELIQCLRVSHLNLT